MMSCVMRAGDVNEGKRRTCSSSIRARRRGCSRCISNSFISNAIVLVHEVAGLQSLLSTTPASGDRRKLRRRPGVTRPPMFRQPLLTLIVVAASVIASAAYAQNPADVLIRHATIVDVEHARLIADQAVVTAGDRILAVGPDGTISRAWKASKTLDAGKRFLISGLWDMHVHFGGGVDLIEENKALLPLYVAHGITTIRDCSGDLPEQVLAWRREIAGGALFGPTLLSSGPKIEGIKPVWKGTLETGSEADVDAAIAKLKALDVDFVKITDSTLKPELFLYAVSKARAAGLRTSGHIPIGITVRQA